MLQCHSKVRWMTGTPWGTGACPAAARLDRRGAITLEYAVIAAIFVVLCVASFPPLAEKVAELLGRVQF